MKYRNRAFALVISFVMVLTLLPAAAFADSGTEGAAARPDMEAKQDEAARPGAESAAAKVPQAMEYTTESPLEGRAGKKEASPNVEGAVLTVSYKDGSTEVYKYMPGIWDGVEYTYTSWMGWYLNGDYDAPMLDGSLAIVLNGRLQEGENKCRLRFDYGDGELYQDVTVIGVPSPEIVSVSYKHHGLKLTGTVDRFSKMIAYFVDENTDNDIVEDYKELRGDTITIVRREESYEYNAESGGYDPVINEVSEEYTCKHYKAETETGSWNGYYFIRELENGEVEKIFPEFYDDQQEGEWTWTSGGTGEVTVAYDGVEAPQKLQVRVPKFTAVRTVKLEMAPGFIPDVSAGQNDEISEAAFYGKGNKIVTTLADGSSLTFPYQSRDKGFCTADGKRAATLSCNLKEQGITLEKDVPSDVTLTFSWIAGTDKDGRDITDEMDFVVPITASYWLVDTVDIPDCEYTGKVVTPKAGLRTVYGNNPVPAEAYTVEKPKYKSIGYHDFLITIKADYRGMYKSNNDDHRAEVECGFLIRPKRPTGLKPYRLKKGFKARWKKLSKSAQKKVDGIAVVYSTSKDFKKTKVKYAKKSATSLKVTGLKSKKTYYVRVYTYKKVDGTKLRSLKPAKTFTVKTK